MKRLAFILVALLAGNADAITYTLVNGTAAQNVYSYSGWVMSRVYTQSQLRVEGQSPVLGGTYTGHTGGMWVGAQAQKTVSYTDQAGTTTAAASVIPEALKTASLTNPQYECKIIWDNDCSVCNIGGGSTHRGIAKGYGFALAKNVFAIDPIFHGQVNGKIITFNYALNSDWSINGLNYTSLDNAQPWLYVQCGGSEIMARWQANNNRWFISGSIQNGSDTPTPVTVYDYDIDMAIVSGITQYCPTGLEDEVDTGDAIPLKVVAGNEAMPSNFWLSTDVSSGGTGANPIVAGTDLILYALGTFNVHD